MSGRRPSVGLFWSRPDRTHHLARKLRERGFPVVHYNVQGFDGAPYVQLTPRFTPACARLLRTAHDLYFTALCFVPALCVWVNRRLRGKPYVFNCTGVMWEMYRDRASGRAFPRLCERHVYPFLARRILGGASRVVCNSRFLETRLAARYPEFRPKLMTIYNGIEADRYGAGRRTALPGVPADSRVVVCVTTLNFDAKSRGLELVIDAFDEVWRRSPRARLVIAAKVAHSRYAERVERYLAGRPSREAVSIAYNARTVPDLLASADVFAFATPEDSNDSLPRVLLEAQSAGVPCVATDTTGCGEIVEDGVTGFAVDYDARAMADAITTLLDSAGQRREFGEAARARVARTFNWDTMADRYAEVFQAMA